MEVMKNRTVTISPNGEPFAAICPICGNIVNLTQNMAFNVMVPDNMHFRDCHSIIRDNREIMSSMIFTPASNLNERPMFDVTCDSCHTPMFIAENEYIAKIARALFMGLHINVIEMSRAGILIEAFPTDFNAEILRDLIGTFFDVYPTGQDPNVRAGEKRYRDLRFRSKEWCDAFIEYVDKYFMHPENYSHHNWDYLQINIRPVATDEFLSQLKKAVKCLEMKNPTILHYMYRRTMSHIEADMSFVNHILQIRNSSNSTSD